MPRKEVRNPNRMQFKGKNIIANYLKAKQVVEQRLWHAINGRCVTLFKGEWVTPEELKKNFPVLQMNCFLANMDNPNKKKNYSI